MSRASDCWWSTTNVRALQTGSYLKEELVEKWLAFNSACQKTIPDLQNFMEYVNKNEEEAAALLSTIYDMPVRGNILHILLYHALFSGVENVESLGGLLGNNAVGERILTTYRVQTRQRRRQSNMIDARTIMHSFIRDTPLDLPLLKIMVENYGEPSFSDPLPKCRPFRGNGVYGVFLGMNESGDIEKNGRGLGHIRLEPALQEIESAIRSDLQANKRKKLTTYSGLTRKAVEGIVSKHFRRVEGNTDTTNVPPKTEKQVKKSDANCDWVCHQGEPTTKGCAPFEEGTERSKEVENEGAGVRRSTRNRNDTTLSPPLVSDDSDRSPYDEGTESTIEVEPKDEISRRRSTRKRKAQTVEDSDSDTEGAASGSDGRMHRDSTFATFEEAIERNAQDTNAGPSENNVTRGGSRKRKAGTVVKDNSDTEVRVEASRSGNKKDGDSNEDIFEEATERNGGQATSGGRGGSDSVGYKSPRNLPKKKQRGKRRQPLTKEQQDRLNSFLNSNETIDWNKALTKHITEEALDVQFVSDQKTPTLLMYCCSVAYAEVTKFLNSCQLPVESITHAGIEGRIKLGLPHVPEAKEMKNNFLATCTPVLTRRGKQVVKDCLARETPFVVASPMVVDIQNAYSMDFKEAYFKVLDELSYVADTRGNQTAVYRCSYKAKDKGDCNPIVIIGKRAAVGIPAEEKESVLNDIHTELSLLFNDATREIMRKVLEVEPPAGYESWKCHYTRVVQKVKAIQSSRSESDKATLLQELRSLKRKEMQTTGILDDYNSMQEKASEEMQEKASEETCEQEQITKRRRLTEGIPNGKKEQIKKGRHVGAGINTNNSKLPKPTRPDIECALDKSSKSLSCPNKSGLADAIRTLVKDDLPFQHDDCLPFEANLHLSKIGQGDTAAYNFHKDSSFILCSPSHKNYHTLKDGRRLPVQAEMAVMTTCLNSDGYPGHTSLQHRLESTEEILTDLKITGNHMHIQSPYCQSGDIKHGSHHVLERLGKGKRKSRGPKVEALIACRDNETEAKQELMKDVFRVIITSRFCSLPDTDPEVYSRGIHRDKMSKEQAAKKLSDGRLYNNYNETNVLTSRRRIVDRHGDTVDKLVEPFVPWPRQPKDTPSPTLGHPPCYAKMPAEEQLLLHQKQINVKDQLPDLGGIDDDLMIDGIPKPERHACLKSNRAAVAHDSMVVEYFLRHQEIPTVEIDRVDGKAAEAIFTIDHVPLYPTQSVHQDDIGLTKTERAKEYIDQKNPTVLTLEQLYKSIPYMIDIAFHYFHRLRKWCEVGGDEEELKTLKSEFYEILEIVTFGSGGSCNKPGAYAPGPKSGPSDCHHGASQSQDPSDGINATFELLNRLEGPVALMCNTATFFDKKMKRETDREKLDDNAWGRNQKINDRIHAANMYINHWIDNASPAERQGYMSFGYWQINQITIGRPPTLRRVIDSFDTLPGYLQSNKTYTSFRLEKAMELRLTLAFSFETNVQLMQNGLLKTPRQFNVRYLRDSRLPIQGKLTEMQSHAYHSLSWDDQNAIAAICSQNDAIVSSYRCSQSTEKDDGNKRLYPVEWIGTRQIIAYICSLPKKQFDRIMNVKDSQASECEESSEQAPDEDKSNSFRVPSIGGMLALLMSVVVAAAARSNPRRSVREGSKGKYVVPLCCPGSEELPPAHRLSGMPLPNPDLDVANCFFYANAEKLNEILKPSWQSFGTEGVQHESRCPLDLNIEENATYMKNLIFMATMLRLTGDVPHLMLFGDYVKKRGTRRQRRYASINLPTLETKDLYKQFLREFKGQRVCDHLSKQFQRKIPEVFKDKEHGFDNFDDFIDNYAGIAKNSGMKMLDRLFQTERYRDRATVTECLSIEIGASAGVNADENTRWIAHKIMGDIEMVAHGVFGPVTFESLGFGFGSHLGLVYTDFGIDPRLDAEAKFEEVHRMMEQGLRDLQPDLLKLLGYQKQKDGNVISILTGRAYSMIDTEHIMCKVYICALLVHPSRTISASKEKSQPHIWPLYEQHGSMKKPLKLFEEIWELYSASDNSKALRSYMRDNYPKHFDYPEVRWVDVRDQTTLDAELWHTTVDDKTEEEPHTGRTEYY